MKEELSHVTVWGKSIPGRGNGWRLRTKEKAAEKVRERVEFRLCRSLRGYHKEYGFFSALGWRSLAQRHDKIRLLF